MALRADYLQGSMASERGAQKSAMAQRAVRLIQTTALQLQSENLRPRPGGLVTALAAVVGRAAHGAWVATLTVAAACSARAADGLVIVKRQVVDGELSRVRGVAVEPAKCPLQREHVGAIGQGCAMKMINNMLAQINRIVIAEALVLGARAGLDPKQMVELIGKATGNSAAFQIYAPRMLAHNFAGSRMDITFKDMELQTSLGKSLKVPLFMANMAQQVCQMGRAAGFGSEDGSAIVKVYEQLAGISLGPRD